jgi:hypothetical protein
MVEKYRKVNAKVDDVSDSNGVYMEVLSLIDPTINMQ